MQSKTQCVYHATCPSSRIGINGRRWHVEDIWVWGFQDADNDHAWCTTRKPCNGWGTGTYVLWCFFYYTVVVSDTYWYGYIMFEFLLMMKISKRWEYFSSRWVFFLYLCHGTETLEVWNSLLLFIVPYSYLGCTKTLFEALCLYCIYVVMVSSMAEPGI